MGRTGPVAIVARELKQIGTAQVFSFRASEIALQIEVFWDVHAESWLRTRLAA